MMTFDDLDPAAQRLINSSITLSPSGVLALLNDFNIGPEYLPELLFALHEHDKLVIHRWNLENAARERGVFESALKVARKWPEQAKFRHTDDGSVIFDKFGIYDPHIPMVATTEMFVGLLEAAVADASELIKIAEEGLAQIAAIGNRAPKDRYLLWHALLDFWKDVLRREIRYKSDPYADGDDRPVGPVIDFLCAASREFLPATTRQAIYAFLKRQKPEGGWNL
jgi:hypothetical protein